MACPVTRISILRPTSFCDTQPNRLLPNEPLPVQVRGVSASILGPRTHSQRVHDATVERRNCPM
jgi:hypothetical protein